MRKSQVFKGVKMNRPVQYYDYFIEEDPDGFRINVLRWLDINSVMVRLIAGDWKEPNFTEYKTVLLKNPTDEDVDNLVTQMAEKAKKIRFLSILKQMNILFSKAVEALNELDYEEISEAFEDGFPFDMSFDEMKAEFSAWVETFEKHLAE